MSAILNCYVRFEITSTERFESLSRAFDALKHDKDHENFRDTEDWLTFFDDRCLSHFVWITKEQVDAYWELWWATPASERHRIPTPAGNSHQWDFESMLLAIQNGEYEFVACRLLSDDEGVLEFDPWAWPYGGADSLIALVRCFDLVVVAVDRGFGIEPNPV